MDVQNYVEIGLSAIGLLGGLLSYILSLKVKHDILQNNEKIEKEISVVKEKLTATKEEVLREIGAALTRLGDKVERVDRDMSELTASMTDRVLTVVNGKYVRTDLHQQSMAGVQERFTSMKDLIEVNMDKIEQSLDRQILDLKDRIFHGK